MTERIRILVVDDSPHMRRFFERFLTDCCEVDTAADGAQAIELLGRGNTYDVLLVDLAMPLVDGRALYETVRTRFPAQLDRIVFLTGGAFTSDAEEFLRSIPNEVVEKPFDNEVLRETIRRIGGLTT
jgi:two-component system, cell cycle sensor histidine kinase and response regulator CckA